MVTKLKAKVAKSKAIVAMPGDFDTKALKGMAREEQEDYCIKLLKQVLVCLPLAVTYQDGKIMRDLAEHVRIYTQQQRLSEEIKDQAEVIKTLALHRMGIIEKQREKNKGGQHSKSTDTGVGIGTPLTNKELGIDPKLSALAQRHAAIPFKELETILHLPPDIRRRTLDKLIKKKSDLVSVRGQVVYGVFDKTKMDLRRLGYPEELLDGSLLKLPLFERLQFHLEKGAKKHIEPPQELLTSALILGLKDRNAEELASMLVSRLSEALEYRNLEQGFDSCKLTSLLFNPHRLSIKIKDKNSVIDALKSDRDLKALAGLILRSYIDPYPLTV